MQSLKASPILIFGASGTIGSYSAQMLKKNNFQVLLSSSRKNKKLKDLSYRLKSDYLGFNLTRDFDANMLRKKIKKYTSSLSGIIISVALPFPNKFLHNTEDNILIRQLKIHVIALDKIIKSCLPLLEKSKKDFVPRITYISTEYLIGSPPIKIGPYLAAKSAATTYAKVLAKELINKGIKVFIVSPGMIKSNLTAELPEEYMEQIKKHLPGKRLTSANEIALTINAIYKGYLDASYGNEIQVSNAERR